MCRDGQASTRWDSRRPRKPRRKKSEPPFPAVACPLGRVKSAGRALLRLFHISKTLGEPTLPAKVNNSGVKGGLASVLGAAGEGGDPTPTPPPLSTGPWGGPRAQQVGMQPAQVIRMSQGRLRPRGSPTGERCGQAASPTQRREAPERLGTPSQAHPAPVRSDPPASETYNASLQKRTHLHWNTGTPSPGTNRMTPAHA